MLFNANKTQLLTSLETQESGSSSQESQRRLADFGANQITPKVRKNYPLEYLKEYISFFPILLEVAAVLAFIAEYFQPGEGNLILGYAILGAVFANATFTFWQKFKADKAMEALLKLVKSQAKVLRDGEQRIIDATEVVPGDILVLEEGDKVVADGILLSANDLYLNLSVLNGESTPALRSLEPGQAKRELEAKNMVFAGASITAGNGLAVVSATGDATEFGKIARLTANVVKTQTPIDKEIKSMTTILTLLAVMMGIVFFVLGLFSDQGLLIAAIFALSLIVANVPEGLLPTITLALSLASQRMAKRSALIKNLDSVETLGSATVICTDKTGTLTQNEMTLKELWLANGENAKFSGNGYFSPGEVTLSHGKQDQNLSLAPIAGALNSHAQDHQQALGDPTEIALAVAAQKYAQNMPLKSPGLVIPGH